MKLATTLPKGVGAPLLLGTACESVAGALAVTLPLLLPGAVGEVLGEREAVSMEDDEAREDRVALKVAAALPLGAAALPVAA